MANNILPGEHDWMSQVGGPYQIGGNPTMGIGIPSPAPARGPGILDRIGGAMFGGGSYGGLLSGDEKKAAQRQAMMAMASQLMAAGGSSPTRTSFGQALGPALMAGQQAYGQAGKDMLEAMLLKTKLQTAGQTTAQKDYQYAKANGYTGTFEEWKRTGTKASSGVQEYEYAKANGYKGTFEEWKRVASAQPTTPAEIQAWELFNSLPPDKQQQWIDFKRNSQPYQVVDVGGGKQLLNKSSGSLADVTTVEQEAAGAGQIAGATAAGRAQGDIAGTRTGKAPTAYATYQAGVKALDDSLSNTSTGPLVGRIPAITANQQTAEGGIATMAPVLKELFRSAGEGTFTEGDQAILMQMVPTRTDHKEARKAKLQMIDSIVRAKLGISADDAPEQASSAPVGVGQTTTINGVKVKRVK
jgi:hypothetical protein